jgi:hypothetical protein
MYELFTMMKVNHIFRWKRGFLHLPSPMKDAAEGKMEHVTSPEFPLFIGIRE